MPSEPIWLANDNKSKPKVEKPSRESEHSYMRVLENHRWDTRAPKGAAFRGKFVHASKTFFNKTEPGAARKHPLN